jgi:hypothetical protein
MPRDAVPESEGRAWLKGAKVSWAKQLLNQRVRVIAGDHAGDIGWIVAIEPFKDSEPIYTVELPAGDPNTELPESWLEPADPPA